MIDINLIPPNLRKKRKGQFAIGQSTLPLEVIIGIGGGFLAFLFLLHVTLFLVDMSKKAYKMSLQKQWDNMSPAKQKFDAMVNDMHSLQSKQKTIEDLVGSSRILWSQKLNILSDLLPRGVWLRKMELQDSLLLVEGSAISRKNEEMTNVHSFASSLKANKDFMDHFSDLELGAIQTRTIGKVEIADFIFKTKSK